MLKNELDEMLDACARSLDTAEGMSSGRQQQRESVEIHARLFRMKTSVIDQGTDEQQERFLRLAQRLFTIFVPEKAAK